MYPKTCKHCENKKIIPSASKRSLFVIKFYFKKIYVYILGGSNEFIPQFCNLTDPNNRKTIADKISTDSWNFLAAIAYIDSTPSIWFSWPTTSSK